MTPLTLPLPCSSLISFIPSPSDHHSLCPGFSISDLYRASTTFPLFHSLTYTRSSWTCLAVFKTLSRVASQARATACTHQTIHHNRPRTDVAPSKPQATPAVTTSAPSQETLSTQHLWVLPRTPQPFTSITKSKIKDTSVLDG